MLGGELEIVSLCPFPAGTLLWENQPGQRSLTVCVKGTFAIVPGGECAIAETQDSPAAEAHWEQNPLASLYLPGDFAPIKRRVDVMLVGHAYAPRGSRVKELVAVLRVGELAKSLRVVGDRRWVHGRGGLVAGEPEPFESMPIRYERAALGGDNPVGFDPNAAPAQGAHALPNIEAPNENVVPGFGPIAATWRPRRRLLDDAALFWAYSVGSPGRGSAGPAPARLDFSFFNAAPRDQQIEMLRSGTKIALENLHPDHPSIVTDLPPVRPQAFRLHPKNGRLDEIVLRCDSVWIDADRGVVTLTWRGLADLGAEMPGKIVVAADLKGKKLRQDAVQRMLVEGEHDDAEIPDPLAVRYDSVKPSKTTASEAPPGLASAPPPGTAPPPAPPAGEEGEGAATTRKLPPLPQIPGFPALPRDMGIDDSTQRLAATRELIPVREPIETADVKVARGRPVLPFVKGKPGKPTLVASPPPMPTPSPKPRSRDSVEDATQAVELPNARRPVMPFSPPAAAPVATPPPPPPEPKAPVIPPPSSKSSKIEAQLPPPAPDHEDLAQARYYEKSPPIPIDESTTDGNYAIAIPPPHPFGPVATDKRKPEDPPTTQDEEKPPEAPSPAPPPEQEPLSLETYAETMAAINARGADKTKVLTSRKIDEATWAATDKHWSKHISEHTDRGDRDPLHRYDVAYVAAQEKLGKPIGVPEYAKIMVGVERGEVGKVLAELDLQLADLMRIQRVWTRRVAEKPDLGASLKKAVDQARKAKA